MTKPFPTYQDLQNASKRELMDHYKLDQRGMEQAIRRQMPGARQEDIERAYKEFYGRK